MKKIITGIYIGFGLFDLINILFDLPLRMISKPTLMVCLIMYYVLFSPKAHPLILMALIFSMMGDLFLLFPSGFLLGLAAFLVAHVFYSFFFLKQLETWSKKHNLTLLALALIMGGFWSMLFPESMQDNWMAVLAYSLVLCSMLFLAINRKSSLSGYLWVVLGAILFVMSDTLIAIEQTMPDQKVISLLIMILYLSAQYLIIEGVVSFEKENKTLLTHTP